MNRLLLTGLFLLVSVNAHAGMFVFHEGQEIIGRKSSCGAVCSTHPNATRVTKQEYHQAGLANKKIDTTVVTGSRIVDMTQVEIDAIVQANADAVIVSKTQSTNNLDVSIKEAFIAWLKVYNSKVPAQYRVTGAELIQQLKTDRGL